MTNRTFAYQARCDGDGAVNIICPQGIKSYDNLRYGDDGMLYIGRSKRGRPYMVQASYGGTDMVVRHSELKNAKRFEALRWKVLEHLASLVAAREATIAAMKEVAVRNKVRGPYDNAWWEIHFTHDKTIDKRVLKVDEENILDALVTMGSQEEHRLLNIYLRQEELLGKYWVCASRLSYALCGLLRDLVPGRRHQFGRRDAQFIVNGRSYIVDDDLRTNSPDRHWPSPFIQIFDLDK